MASADICSEVFEVLEVCVEMTVVVDTLGPRRRRKKEERQTYWAWFFVIIRSYLSSRRVFKLKARIDEVPAVTENMIDEVPSVDNSFLQWANPADRGILTSLEPCTTSQSRGARIQVHLQWKSDGHL